MVHSSVSVEGASVAIPLSSETPWCKMKAMTMKRLKNRDEFDGLLDEPIAVVYKHSTSCGISFGAMREAEKFEQARPDVVIHAVYVLEDRPVSDYIEERTGIRHESPQILILRQGEVVWHDSHSRITAEAIQSHLESS